MATERIDIIVSEKGSRVVKRNVEDIGNSARKAAGGVDQLQRLLGGLASGAALRQLQRTADAYTNIQNSLRLVTTSSEQLAAVQEELFNISQRTRSSFESNAEVYRRFALAGKDLGVTQNDILKFTEQVNQAIIVSGASGAEAQAGLVQFSQGLASGALRGDELRSVLEQLPAIADILAKELGVTRGELRKMGEEGAITSEIILEAFKNNGDELAAQFAKVSPTIEQGLTNVRNAFTRFIGEIDQANGISRNIASGLIFLAENFDRLGRAILVLGGIVATKLIIGALVPLAAFLVTPIGLLAALAAAFVAFGDLVIVSTDDMVNAFDLFSATFGELYDITVNAVYQIASAFNTGYGSIEEFTGDFGEFIAASIGGTMKLVSEIVAHAFNGILITLEAILNAAVVTGNKVRSLLGQEREETPLFDLGRVDFEAIDQRAQANALQRQSDEQQRQLDRAKQKAELDKLIAGGSPSGLNASGNAQAQKDANKAFERQQKLLESIRGPALSYNQTLKDLNILLEDGKISTDQYNEAMRDLNIQVLELDNTIQGGFKRGLLEIGKEFGNVSDLAAKTLVNAFQGAEDALVNFVRTGKLEFGDLVNSILDDLARLAVRQNITGPLAGLLGLGGDSGGGGLGGGGGILGSILGSFGGGETAGSGIFGGIQSLFGFANGGEFQVGGVGGTDSQLVAFRASPNETVTIRRPDQQQGSGSGNNFSFNFSIDARGADSGVEQRIEAAINKAKPSLRQEAVQAVSEAYRRNPNYLPKGR